MLIPLLLAVAYSSLLGMAWYSDTLFGKAWRKALGIREADAGAIKKGAGGTLAEALAGTAATMLGLWFFSGTSLVALTGRTGIGTVWAGALVGALVWLFFVVPTAFQAAPSERTRLIATRITLAYRLAELAGAGAILALWR